MHVPDCNIAYVLDQNRSYFDKKIIMIKKKKVKVKLDQSLLLNLYKIHIAPHAGKQCSAHCHTEARLLITAARGIFSILKNKRQGLQKYN